MKEENLTEVALDVAADDEKDAEAGEAATKLMGPVAASSSDAGGACLPTTVTICETVGLTAAAVVPTLPGPQGDLTNARLALPPPLRAAEGGEEETPAHDSPVSDFEDADFGPGFHPLLGYFSPPLSDDSSAEDDEEEGGQEGTNVISEAARATRTQPPDAEGALPSS